MVTDLNSAALWTITGTSGATIQAVDGQKIHNENQTWTLESNTVNDSQAYAFWVRASSRNWYVYVSSNAINTSPNSGTYSATKNWYLISESQVTAYNNYLAAYNALNTFKNLNTLPDELKTKVSNTLSENNTADYSNATERTTALNSVLNECRKYLVPEDKSTTIVNPDAEDDKNGWTGEFGILGGDGAHFFEPAGWWKTTEASMSQTVTSLPNGYYVLQMKYQAGEHVKVTLTGNTSSNYVQGTNEGWKDLGVVCQVTNGSLTITASSIATDGETQFTWFNTDHFTLTYYGETNPGLTYNNGIKLDGSYLSKPAYTGTPAEGIDPGHENDALLVVTWRDNYTNDPKTPWVLANGSMAEVWADGAKITEVNLLSDFRSSHYDNGFGLYIPNFDEAKTYTIKVPENVFGYTNVGHGNEAFEVQAVASPIKDGKYFVVVKGTGKHVSRGKGWGTQAILDYYGVPMLVQTAGLTVFKFLDNGSFLGSDPTDDWLFTDIQGSEAQKVRRYILMPGEGEHEGEFQFYTPARDKYLSHTQNSIAGETYDAVNEGSTADYFQFELLDEEGYKKHLKGIENDEAMRVAQRAGIVVEDAAEYNAKVAELESSVKDGEGNYLEASIIFPKTESEKTLAAQYFEKKNEELACDATWEGTPRDLVGGEKVNLTLKSGIYEMSCDAFQQAMNLSTLQANQGFRGLTYMYVKVGSVMYKSQLKSITETSGDIPENANSAKEALDNGTYENHVLFYVPTDNTQVEFGVENPQRLGNGKDEGAGSWVAFKNIQVVKFGDVVEANMTIAQGDYGTFIAPFAVTLPADVSAYTVGEFVNGTSVSLQEANNHLEACTPVIVYNNGTEDVNMTYRDFDARANKSIVREQKGYLVGFYEGFDGDINGENNGAYIDGAEGAWVLQTKSDGKTAFYKVDPSKKFKGAKNRCYLKAEGAASAATVLNIGFGEDDDFETSIMEIEDGKLKMETVIYDLSGRRVNSTAKGGIYIINGKKVVK